MFIHIEVEVEFSYLWHSNILNGHIFINLYCFIFFVSRLPSGWLGLDKSVYDLMVQTMGSGKWRGSQYVTEQINSQTGGSQPESQETKAQYER